MAQPSRPRLPRIPPEPPPGEPNPMHRPDERKEGGPDYGKAEKQQENRRKTKNDAEKQASE